MATFNPGVEMYVRETCQNETFETLSGGGGEWHDPIHLIIRKMGEVLVFCITYLIVMIKS